MAELLLGESKLEQYLKEQPLRQGASPRGPRPQLTEVRKHLTATLDRGNLKVLWASGMRRDRGGMLAPPPLSCVVGGDPHRPGQCSEHVCAAMACLLGSRPAPCAIGLSTPRPADHLVGASAQQSLNRAF